ncbi:MAG: NADH-quinone oxidoreductase subunit NuoE [Bifidobacteriaceae bacterium]|jgi:NADH-quinone oxidoreductase subunit E|nr:NADH-quinone oxidoreductase subunit NuoE [Bifidobacteriaceae bacterium]
MTYAPKTLQALRQDAEAVIGRYPSPRSALLPLLHLVQSVDGYVSADGIAFCADRLGLTSAEVSAVATFYSQFKRQPNGQYTLGVCVTSLCGLMGGDAVFAKLSEYLDVGNEQTTPDGLFTLERIECNAACDYAPVVMVNWEFFDNQTPASAVRLVNALRAGQPVRPSRGPDQVHTFKEVSRVLAGFPDGHADEGPGAGAASLAGVALAAERGWAAPPAPPGAVDAVDDAAPPAAVDDAAPPAVDAAAPPAGVDDAAPAAAQPAQPAPQPASPGQPAPPAPVAPAAAAPAAPAPDAPAAGPAPSQGKDAR